MKDLVQFLRDRLDEDFEAVRVTLGANVMAAIQDGKPVPRWVPSPKNDAEVWDTDRQPRVKFVWPRERDHIIRHDPARVLAEVEAKRRVVNRIANHADLMGWDEVHGDVLRSLAAVYADHPDYRTEWRP